MKPLQGQNLDLLAMLSGKAKGAGKATGKSVHEGADLLAMLGGSLKPGDKGGALNKSEFAEILSQKGMLEDISSEDLLKFFKKAQSTEGEPVTQLLQNYADLTGKSIDINALSDKVKGELQELSFDGSEFSKPNGEVVPKNKILKLLSKIQENASDSFSAKVKDFKDIENLGSKRLADMPIKQSSQKSDKKALLGKSDATDFVDHKMAISKKSSRLVAPKNFKNNDNLVTPKVLKNNIALNQYNKENHKLNNSLIQSKNGASKLGQASTVNKQRKFENKENAEGSSQDSVDINLFDTLSISDLKSQDAGKQEFNMNRGQNTQTLDLSNISGNNKTELMQKVGNYIEQSYVRGKGSVDMVVNHEELGQFRVQAHKVGKNGQVNLEINTVTDKGHQFFAENEVELLKTLNKSGIKLNDFKITPQSDFLSLANTSKSSMNSDSSSSSFSGGGERGEASAFTQGGRQGDNRGEDRRRQLWQDAKSFSEQMYA